MARRQNKQAAAGFILPQPITKPIAGLDDNAKKFINALLFGFQFGQNLFGPDPLHQEDWIVLFVILSNHAEGRATVTKNIVEMTGRAYPTVRTSLDRFESFGYIKANQHIGRSALYVPTDKLKKEINIFAKGFWSNLNQLQ